MKVLLTIDDSGTIRALIKVHLAGMGFEFEEACDGAEGLQVAERSQPQVIIADLHMPTMDGIEFCKALRAHRSSTLRNVPIILLTANRDLGVQREALHSGANFFARKPIDGNMLTRLVKKCVG